MKTKLILILLCLAVNFANGQGFIYDQQSTNHIEGAIPFPQIYQNVGQSFTPTLPSVGFIVLQLFDSDSFSNAGATIYVNLRSNSITGPVLGSTVPVFMPGRFIGVTNFLFSTPIAVASGTTYYFQPVIQSGDNFSLNVTDTSYPGTAYGLGSPLAFKELWFQEGIFAVPEPSSALLALLGGGAWLFVRRKRKT